MIFKGSQAIQAGFTEDGLICLEQYSTEFGKSVSIFITLDQFKLIERYVMNWKEDISQAWNDGVEP